MHNSDTNKNLTQMLALSLPQAIIEGNQNIQRPNPKKAGVRVISLIRLI
jgi:hypothetical protein